MTDKSKLNLQGGMSIAHVPGRKDGDGVVESMDYDKGQGFKLEDETWTIFEKHNSSIRVYCVGFLHNCARVQLLCFI